MSKPAFVCDARARGFLRSRNDTHHPAKETHREIVNGVGRRAWNPTCRATGDIIFFVTQAARSADKSDVSRKQTIESGAVIISLSTAPSLLESQDFRFTRWPLVFTSQYARRAKENSNNEPNHIACTFIW